MIAHTDCEYGPSSIDALDRAGDQGPDGARAVLETFYYALNHQDESALAAVWAPHELVQLNNPVGGIMRGGEDIVELYGRILNGPVKLTVTFADIVEYLGTDHAVFAGRETGWYGADSTEPTPITIRTTRYFRYSEDRWWQFHHHGSIDDPSALAAYQTALNPPEPG